MNRNSPPLNLMFYGFNPDFGAGKASLEDLATTIRERSIKPNIGSIFLPFKNKKGRALVARSYTADIETKNNELKITPMTLEESVDYIEKTDILFIMGQNPNYKTHDRLGKCAANLEMISEMQHLFQDFHGHVHIVSNTPEILAYKIALLSDINPSRITGSCEVDRLRLQKYLKMKQIDNALFFTLGYHANSYSFVHGLSRDEKLELTDKVNKEGPYLYELGLKGNGIARTSQSLSNAVTNFILAYNIGNQLINVSAFNPEDELFVEVPSILADAMKTSEITPNKKYLEYLDSFDIAKFNSCKNLLREELNNFGLIKRIYCNPNFRFETVRAIGDILPRFEEVSIEETIDVRVIAPNTQHPHIININNVYSGNLESVIEFDEADEFTSIVNIIQRDGFYALLKKTKNRDSIYTLVKFNENNYEALSEFSASKINNFDVEGNNLFLATVDSIKHFDISSGSFERDFIDHGRNYETVKVISGKNKSAVYGVSNDQIVRWYNKKYPEIIRREEGIRDVRIINHNGLDVIAYSSNDNVIIDDKQFGVTSSKFELTDNNELLTINNNQIIKYGQKILRSQDNETAKQIFSDIIYGIHSRNDYVVLVTDKFHALYNHNLELISNRELPNIGVRAYEIF